MLQQHCKVAIAPYRSLIRQGLLCVYSAVALLCSQAILIVLQPDFLPYIKSEQAEDRNSKVLEQTLYVGWNT